MPGFCLKQMWRKGFNHRHAEWPDLDSGDKINKMQAVCWAAHSILCLITMMVNVHLRPVVKQAQDEGYTEPDPRVFRTWVAKM